VSDVQRAERQDIDLDAIEADMSWNSRSLLTDIKGLAEGIHEVGLLQPVVVREDKGQYKLVAGFRRFAAYKLLRKTYPEEGWQFIPATIKETDAQEARILNLAENLQRKNLRLYDTMRTVSYLSEKGIQLERISRDTGIRVSRLETMTKVWPRLSETVKANWSRIDDPCWEPNLFQVTKWSSLSWSEQNREWKNWCSDEDITAPEPEENETPTTKTIKKRSKQRPVRVIRRMAESLGESETEQIQKNALMWALGRRVTL
jgi:ParB/RepB/Spo0J family partition protein